MKMAIVCKMRKINLFIVTKKMKKIFLLSTLLTCCLGLAATSERQALIIGISEYSMPGTQALKGIPLDVERAKSIAKAMGISDQNITYIKDQEATKENILNTMRRFADSTTEGTRAFVYFSGHGTRWQDLKTGECNEGLLTYDGQAISNAEFAQASKKLATSADKVVSMIDACFSQGVVSPARTRSLIANELTPKFFTKTGAGSDACKATNLTRGLVPEMTKIGAMEENFVQITSSKPNEVSYDTANGSVATQGMTQCLLGEAKDTNGSGGVTMEEVQQCAQKFVDNTLKNSGVSQHISVAGTRNLIPVVLAPPKPVEAAPAPTATPGMTQTTPAAVQVAVNSTENRTASPPQNLNNPSSNVQTSSVKPVNSGPQADPVIPPLKPIEVTAPALKPTEVIKPPEPALASLATLKDIEQQRNPKRQVQVKVNKNVMKIGKDLLDISITSKSDGYVYIVLLGSDKKSFYLLYPNGIDGNNHIKAHQTLRVPKPDWGVKASGPVGTDNLLVMVADSPRKLDSLIMAKPTDSEPYTYALNNLTGRQALIDYLAGSGIAGKSESFGAQLITVKEVK